jgi:glycosyltransferase involved in cell wall biosynthesis
VPELSVVIATHNRAEMLRRCLDSLCEQTADPSSFEVIVADDGSGDGTAELVDGYPAPFELRQLRLQQGGQARAQNIGIEAARGAAVLTLDDDVIASPTLIEAHVRAHRGNSHTIGVGALTQAPLGDDDWFTQCIARGWSEHYEELETRPANWADCYGANVSFPRQALLDAGGIATDLLVAFDLDVALRLSEAGCVPRFLPEAHGVHDDKRKGMREILRDATRQGTMHVDLAERYPHRMIELLNWSRGAGRVELELRRLVVLCRIRPNLFAGLGRFLPGQGRKMIWLHFVLRIAFWRGVRRRVDRREWWILTHVDPTSAPPETAGAISTLFLEGGFPL